LRALIDLAIFSQNGQVALHQIAQRQNLSIKYLEQDFATLRKAGLVRSIKGAQGGYVLSRPADQIRVGDIIRVLEGDLSLVDLDDNPEHQTEIRRFLNAKIWLPLSQRIEEKMNALTLADLAAHHQNEIGQDPMYYI
ncbi:MAG: rrf2 family protein, putative transcriptional regulator, partial [Firmicutes bacterium]|nr:rrf2 family protein, putative transcriptional regulator [Bacillota bacterium]